MGAERCLGAFPKPRGWIRDSARVPAAQVSNIASPFATCWSASPNHVFACSPIRNRGAGGHSGRRVCKLARDWCGGTRGAQRVEVGAGASLVPETQLIPRAPDSKAHGVLGSLGTFLTVDLCSPSKPLHLALALPEGSG